jgi:hypothetical protein
VRLEDRHRVTNGVVPASFRALPRPARPVPFRPAHAAPVVRLTDERTAGSPSDRQVVRLATEQTADGHPRGQLGRLRDQPTAGRAIDRPVARLTGDRGGWTGDEAVGQAMRREQLPAKSRGR